MGISRDSVDFPGEADTLSVDTHFSNGPSQGEPGRLLSFGISK